MNRRVNKYSGVRDWNSWAERFHRQEIIEPTWEPSRKLDRTVRYRDYERLTMLQARFSNKGGTAEKFNPIPSLF